jgi:phage gpG-like protein
MIGIRLTWHDRDFRKLMGGTLGRFKDLSKPLRECGLVGLRSISKTFKAGGRPVRWKPSRRAKLSGGKTLIDTARLMRSITMEPKARSVSWGTNVKYGPIHDLGGTIPARTVLPRRAKALRWIDASGNVRFAKRVRIPATQIPAREFLVIQDEDWRVFRRIFEDHVTK